MGPRSRRLITDGCMILGVLAILSLLAAGQIAATVLVTLPLVFVAFGRHRD
jgi:hypothetical protein